MGSRRRKSRRRKSLLPRFSTVVLVIVAGVAVWFFMEMNKVNDGVAQQEQERLEQELVKKQSTQLVDAINEALDSDSIDMMARARLMKARLDSGKMASLDTMLARNQRYEHLRTAIEEAVLMPRSGVDSVSYPDTLALLFEAYAQIETLSIADSCATLSRKLSAHK